VDHDGAAAGGQHPQFDWVLNRLPNHPRPVAPVYQPEVAAQAVVHAADHPRRREYWVGGSTVGTLVANKLVPGLLDRYLAGTAYEAQQNDQPADPGRPVNLWEPVDGRDGRDFGAHGAFDDEAANRSVQAWVGRPGSRRDILLGTATSARGFSSTSTA
jgi:hypothetical protein